MNVIKKRDFEETFKIFSGLVIIFKVAFNYKITYINKMYIHTTCIHIFIYIYLYTSSVYICN